MNFRKWLVLATFAMAASCVTSLGSRSATAQGDFIFVPKFKVQFYYVYWDTDNYHWSTIFETNDYRVAQRVRRYLQREKEAGRLNQVASELNGETSWRYICLDFRIVMETERIAVNFDRAPVLKIKPKPRSIKRR